MSGNSNSTVPDTSTNPPAGSSAPPPSSSTTTNPATSPPATTPGGSDNSSTPAPATSPPKATTTTPPPPATPDTTSTVSAPSNPPSTQLITSVITQTGTGPGQTPIPPVTVVVTSEVAPTSTAGAGPATSTSSGSPALQNGGGGGEGGKSSTGLPPAGRTAIAVVVPIVAVALLVLAALFFWRKRKQRRQAEEARRKEVEEYAYNPNSDPTLPAVAADGSSDMAEDHGSGYRGWGAAAGAMSARKASTTLSGGHTQGKLSDTGSNPGGAFSQSPTAVGASDAHQADAYAQGRDTMNSDDLAALGSGPAAGSNNHQQGNNVRRGPSNASSSYSAGHRSDHSDPSLNQRGPGEGTAAAASSSSPQNYGYNTAGPYGDGSYGGGDTMPVVRDNPARRNTRIEPGGGYPQQGASGISQNF